MPTRLDRRGRHPAGSARPVLRLVEQPPEPVRLDPETLLWLAQLYGTSCVYPWSERGVADPVERATRLVELSVDFEVWAIHWPPASQLQLHDHGGASGALWVVSGSLTETVQAATTRFPTSRSLTEGTGIGFGPEHIHEVLNPGSAVTTSVHVYSPPMAHMTFFQPGESGVVPERTDVRKN